RNQTVLDLLERHDTRRGRHAESPARLEAIELELDVGFVKGHVRAALDVCGAPVWIVERLTVDGDVHEVEPERTLWRQLARHPRNINAFVIIENRELIIDNLNDDVRSLALSKAHVDHVVRLHVAATFVLRL